MINSKSFHRGALIQKVLGKDALQSWNNIMNGENAKQYSYVLFLEFLCSEDAIPIPGATLTLGEDGELTLLIKDLDINFGEEITHILNDRELDTARIYEMWVCIKLHLKRLDDDRVLNTFKEDAVKEYIKDTPYPDSLRRAIEHYAEFPYILLDDVEQMRMVRAQVEGLSFLLEIYDELAERKL